MVWFYPPVPAIQLNLYILHFIRVRPLYNNRASTVLVSGRTSHKRVSLNPASRRRALSYTHTYQIPHRIVQPHGNDDARESSSYLLVQSARGRQRPISGVLLLHHRLRPLRPLCSDLAKGCEKLRRAPLSRCSGRAAFGATILGAPLEAQRAAQPSAHPRRC